MRNKCITRKRAPIERTYAVIKNIFKSGHVKVTTTLRTHTKNITHLLMLQHPTTKHPQTKKQNLATLTPKNKNTRIKQLKKKKHEKITNIPPKNSNTKKNNKKTKLIEILYDLSCRISRSSPCSDNIYKFRLSHLCMVYRIHK